MTAKRSLKIYFFGDSIFFGQLVSPHKVWIAEVSRLLDAKYGAVADIVVQNPSINGNTTRMALERIAYDVQSHAPEIVATQFGMNDCNVWQTDNGHPRTSRDGFQANLREIIARVRAAGAKEVLLGINHPTTRTTAMMAGVDFTYEANNRAYNKLSREVGAAAGVPMVDMEKHFDAAIAAKRFRGEDLVLADQLHLSEYGHALYVEGWTRPILEAAARVLKV